MAVRSESGCAESRGAGRQRKRLRYVLTSMLLCAAPGLLFPFRSPIVVTSFSGDLSSPLVPVPVLCDLAPYVTDTRLAGITRRDKLVDNMLAFDDEMFKAEFFLSDPNSSSTSCDLGSSPNPEAVMDLEDLLFGSGIDLIGSHLQTAVSSGGGVDQEDSDGELADLLTSDDPHRTDSRDENEQMMSTGRSVSEELFPVNTEDRSNRRDHDYDLKSSADEEEDDDDDDQEDPDDVVPQTRVVRSGQSVAAATRHSGNKLAAAAPDSGAGGKRMGLRSQPVRKRCFSTSSTTSLDFAASPTTSRGPAAKKRKPSGGSHTDKCMTRNAIAARENRERKKAQFRDMEEQVEQLEEENQRLQNENECKTNAMATLIQEVTYLRGVVSNTPEIAALIQSIRKTPAIKDFRTSFGTSLRSNPRGKKIQDENQTPATSLKKSLLKNPVSPPASKSAGEKSGVCLHVVNGSVSLEICANCSRMAARSLSK